MDGQKIPKPDNFEPEPTFREGHRYAGKPRCRAWSGNNGRQCLKLPMKGKRVCRSHGAAGGRPPEHGGRTIAKQYADAYHNAIGHPRVGDLSEEAALITVRVNLLLAELEDLDPEAEDFMKAEEAIWAKIRRALEVKRRLVETRRKIEQDARAVMPLSEVLDLILWLQHKALGYMADHHARARFASDVLNALPADPEPGEPWADHIGPDESTEAFPLRVTGESEDDGDTLLFPN